MHSKKILNRTLSLLIAVVMCWITSSVTLKNVIDEINANAVSNSIIGDVNNDSCIDAFDVVLLRKAIVNSDSSLEMESADVNGDNIIDVRDLREL